MSTLPPMTDATPSPNPSRLCLVFFGGMGTLASKKLFPALLHAGDTTKLLDTLHIVVVDVKGEASSFERHLAEVAADAGFNAYQHDGLRELLRQRAQLVVGDIADSGTFARLSEVLSQSAQVQKGTGATGLGACFYCATRPSLSSSIVEGLATTKLLPSGFGSATSSSRILFEKPFGTDRDSANALSESLAGMSGLKVDQMALVDHYAYKPMVDQLLELRRSDPEIGKLWHPVHIDHVQITVAEQAPT